MFIARARWILTDKEIVDIANINWCKKRNGKWNYKISKKTI